MNCVWDNYNTKLDKTTSQAKTKCECEKNAKFEVNTSNGKCEGCTISGKYVAKAELANNVCACPA